MVLAHAADVSSSLVAVGAITVVLAAAALQPVEQRRRAVLRVATGAFAFQTFHLAEHVLQLGYWVLHPSRPPWITPWAVPARDVLAAAADGRTATGTELLHLVGNAVFLAGIVALAAVSAGYRGRPRRWLRTALVVQGLHVAEHLALTVTWLARGRADGLSTLFGLLPAGTAATGAVRVWFHFTVNLVATAAALAAWWELRAVDEPSASDAALPAVRPV